MKEFKYIIIGGGMTGSSAAMGIRKNDVDGSIAMFSKDEFEPYNRPPLTKSLWDKGKVEDIIRPMDKYLVNLFLNTTIKKLLPDQNMIETGMGEQFSYEKLLLATGGHPNRLKNNPEGVLYYRTLSDYYTLKEQVKEKNQFCVIGGGFIGSEIAAALEKQGKEITMIFPEPGISSQIFPDDLAEFLNDYYQSQGINIIAQHLVNEIIPSEKGSSVKYQHIDGSNSNEKNFDVVIAGIGITLNTFFAQDAGISVENGIIVDEYLQTNQKDIYAAGDVANFHHHGLGKRMRVEHEDNANNMGMMAGQNMSGSRHPYHHIPFFYSDLFDLGYEAVGDFNKDFEIISDWIEPYKKGTLFYRDTGKVQGVIFWNLWGNVDVGRKLISEGKSHKKDELIGMFTAD